MIYLADSRQMKAVDSYSIETLGIPSMVLMERAAYSTALCIRKDCDAASGDCRIHKNTGKKYSGIRVIAVCGSGNNGGDGLAVTRILHTWGFDARYYMVGSRNKATKETLCQLEILERLGVSECTEAGEFAQADILVDAIFGIGLMRPVEGRFAQVIQKVNESRRPIYAVDIPSGIHSDDGRVMGCAVSAFKTVTFGVNKLGLVLYPGAEYAGSVTVTDIGFPEISVEKADISCRAFEPEDMEEFLPKRTAWSNKGTYGKVLIIAGSQNMAGACLLSASAAYHTGCGLVRVFTVEKNRHIVLSSLPEAILTTYDPTAPDFTALAEALSWADSVCIGPGLTTAGYARDMVRFVYEHCQVPLVMDADALNILAAFGREGIKLSGTDAPKVLTPHLGEMSRLTGISIKDIQQQLIPTCQSFAKENGVVCAMKDARTIISDGQQTFVNLSGNNGMATGGSGDVLSGIITGFLAAGMSAAMAAAFGCFVHGCAGDAAYNEKGAYGLLASDIIQYMLKPDDYGNMKRERRLT